MEMVPSHPLLCPFEISVQGCLLVRDGYLNWEVLQWGLLSLCTESQSAQMEKKNVADVQEKHFPERSL